MANNRKCLLCGAEYSYCPSCGADKRKPSWMTAYDKEDCKIIFETLSAYSMKKISNSEAKKIFKKIDINSINLDEYKKETINEILGNKSSVVETPVVEVAETPAPIEPDIVITEELVAPVVEPVETTEEVIDDNVEDVTENVYVPYKKRNKNYKEISE